MRGARLRCGASSPRRSSFRTCAASARPTPTTSASRCRTCSPRRSVPTTPTTRCARSTATRARPRRRAVRPPVRHDRRRRVRFDRGRQWRSAARPTPRRERWVRCRDGTEILDVDTGEPCPPGVTGELVNTSDAGRFEGYYNDPDADAERMRRRRLPQRRSGLPRRKRLRVLRRPARRLDARRRREPRLGADRAGAAAPSRRRGGRGVRDTGARRRRSGDGGGGARPTARPSIRTSSANSSPTNPISARSSGRRSCGSAPTCRAPRPSR